LGLDLAVRGAYRVLLETREAKRLLGRHWGRREDNLKMDLQKLAWVIDRVDLAQGRGRCQEFHCA
jgi:hypothetical protein